MKLVSLLCFAAGLVFSMQSIAADPTVPAELTNACTQKANQSKLKGVDREAYMEQCTAPRTNMSGADGGATPEELKMGCEQKADSKKLKGGDRDAFLADCMSTKNTQKLSVQTIPKDKIHACVSRANARKLKGDPRKSFVRDCLAN